MALICFLGGDIYTKVSIFYLIDDFTTLRRNAYVQNVGVQEIDFLSYTYNGNQVTNIVDNNYNYMGYPESAGTEILYDKNGNMISHEDKGIKEIGYNYLNLPNTVKFNKLYQPHNDPNGHEPAVTKYVYGADGKKLRKIYTYGSGPSNLETTKVSDYIDGFQYTDNVLSFVPTAEGYYDFVQKKYVYQYADQVGNVRVSYYKGPSGSPIIDRVTNYYPFGLEFNENIVPYNSISPNYRYSTQKQEKQEDTGWSSFKWRNYDPTIGRFFNVDPLSEKYAYQSHYNFSENRVVDGRELEGLEWIGTVTRITPVMENTSIRPIIEPLKPEVVNGAPKTSRFTPEQLASFNRGRKVEAEQLSKMNEEGQNIVKNNKNFETTDPNTGKTGKTRPDGFNDEGRPVEVKNVKNQSFTKQLRLQDNLVTGKRLILRINKDAVISKKLQNSGIEIQTYKVVPPVKIDNVKVNNNPPAQVKPQPIQIDKCRENPNCA